MTREAVVARGLGRPATHEYKMPSSYLLYLRLDCVCRDPGVMGGECGQVGLSATDEVPAWCLRPLL